jgi:hypothetical protein
MTGEIQRERVWPIRRQQPSRITESRKNRDLARVVHRLSGRPGPLAKVMAEKSACAQAVHSC